MSFARKQTLWIVSTILVIAFVMFGSYEISNVHWASQGITNKQTTVTSTSRNTMLNMGTVEVWDSHVETDDRNMPDIVGIVRNNTSQPITVKEIIFGKNNTKMFDMQQDVQIKPHDVYPFAIEGESKTSALNVGDTLVVAYVNK